MVNIIPSFNRDFILISFAIFVLQLRHTALASYVKNEAFELSIRRNVPLHDSFPPTEKTTT